MPGVAAVSLQGWLRRLRLPARLGMSFHHLQPGETLWLHHFQGPGWRVGLPGACEISITRQVGGEYQFEALWSIGVGRRERPPVAVFGEFALHAGERIEFPTGMDPVLEQKFCRACRYAARWRQSTPGASVWQGVIVSPRDGIAPLRLALASLLAAATPD